MIDHWCCYCYCCYCSEQLRRHLDPRFGQRHGPWLWRQCSRFRQHVCVPRGFHRRANRLHSVHALALPCAAVRDSCDWLVLMFCKQKLACVSDFCEQALFSHMPCRCSFGACSVSCRSTNIRFANLAGSQGVYTRPSSFVAAGNFTDPRLWNMILHQDSEGICDADKTPGLCSTTRVLDRPVLWQWTGTGTGTGRSE